MSALLLLPAPASARPVVPRGDLPPEERLVIDIFEKSDENEVPGRALDPAQGGRWATTGAFLPPRLWAA